MGRTRLIALSADHASLPPPRWHNFIVKPTPFCQMLYKQKHTPSSLSWRANESFGGILYYTLLRRLVHCTACSDFTIFAVDFAWIGTAQQNPHVSHPSTNIAIYIARAILGSVQHWPWDKVLVSVKAPLVDHQAIYNISENHCQTIYCILAIVSILFLEFLSFPRCQYTLQIY